MTARSTRQAPSAAPGFAAMVTAEEDFDAFARARTPALVRTAYALTGNQHTAEDLVQEALARTLLAWPRLRRAEHAEAYARKVLYHQQVSWWRLRRSREYPTDVLPDRPAADVAVEDRLDLARALDVLTRRQRAVLVLRFLEDRSERETAELLRCSIGTVKSQTSKALARLRTTTVAGILDREGQASS